MQIQILDNEYWWGGAVDVGSDAPYGVNSICRFALGQVGADQSAPLYLSTQGRYLYSDKPFAIEFRDGGIFVESDYPVALGEGFGDLKGAHQAVAETYFSKSEQLPDPVFFRVPQYNTWIELMYNQNQKQILEYAHSIVDNGMTPGILMIDEGWSEDYGVYDFYPGRFSDPKGMVQELHSLGFTVMLWVTPHISPDSNAFRELRQTDFLLRDETGAFAIREWWNGFSCVLDLTNPGAQSWLKEKLDGVMAKYGVDGFKFDAGDAGMYRSTDRSFRPGLPVDQTTAFNAFAAQYPVNELRAVWNMGGAPLVCRLHDKMHSWDTDGLNCILPNTLTQGLIGCYYGCPDMVGGGNYASFLEEGFALDEELYLRWLQASLLCPMVQFSIAPWRVLSPENYRTVKNLLKLRERYADYIVELAKNAARHQEPIVRPMEYEFPHQGYAREKTMFMLGNRYLVAPVLEKDARSRTIRLPNGTWKGPGGALFEGGKAVTLENEITELLILERMDLS